jgi:hypothetical protein
MLLWRNEPTRRLSLADPAWVEEIKLISNPHFLLCFLHFIGFCCLSVAVAPLRDGTPSLAALRQRPCDIGVGRPSMCWHVEINVAWRLIYRRHLPSVMEER